MDYLRKLLKYQKAGVREYWVVDPEKERVIVYWLKEEELVEVYAFEDEIPVRIYEDFSIRIR